MVSAVDDPRFANEWDGLVAFCEVGGEAACAAALSARFGTTKVSVKPARDPIELAMEKFPLLDWAHISIMPTDIYMAAFRRCLKALRDGPSACEFIDVVFGDVVRGLMSYDALRSGSTYELWNGHKWELDCRPVEFVRRVRELLENVFGVYSCDIFGATVVLPPPRPLQKDSFITKVAETMVKYLPNSEHKALDSDVRYRLLFADGMMLD